MIFTPGGIVLYHYRSSPSLLKSVDNPDFHVRHLVEAEVIHDAIGGGATNDTSCFRITQGLTLSWQWTNEFCVVAIYPDILFEGPRKYLQTWAKHLVKTTVDEFALWYKQQSQNHQHQQQEETAAFDTTFRVVLEHSKSKKYPDESESSSTSADNKAKTAAAAKNTKQQRSWGGEAKVTEKAMNALDMNKDSATQEQRDAAYQKALLEARQSYLPSADEDGPSAMDPAKDSAWSSSLSSLFQALSTKKRLTEEDLSKPTALMMTHLQEKNVSVETADALCKSVVQKLKNKQLNTFYSVKTAVQQALGTTLQQILQRNKADIVSAIRRKRKKPYVICILGQNGIGKTTTTAKLAYHFQQNKLRPLLVAADTFRAGAVEQLRLHADCLGVPVYSAGYAVDAATVVDQALQQMGKDADVVLIDTAGRMPTNPELMGNLQRLISRHSPDFILLAVEALVGTDITYYQGFSKAAGNRIDGIVLTKVDTVDDKMGAAITLAQQTQTPIVFCGTGQKYHHLERLNVERVVQSLLA